MSDENVDERDLLRKAAHPFIVRLEAAFETQDKHYFVLEYLSGGRLFFHLER